MSVLDRFENFFKPETRSVGRTYFSKDKINVSRPSDTQLEGFIRGASPYKILLKSPTIDSPKIFATCSCGSLQFCKHVWATLLKAEITNEDFFDGKEELESASAETALAAGKESKSLLKPMRPISAEQADRQAVYKNKQADYRQKQYQKQKQRLKDQKKSKSQKATPSTSAPPEEIREALDFFAENGFALSLPLNATVIGFAKKKLSRVFHPDVGGSHDEILELNQSYEVLLRFLKNQPE